MKRNMLAILACLIYVGSAVHAQESSSNSKTESKQRVKMKEFILLVRVPVNYTTEQAQQVNPKWDAVLAKWKIDNVFVTSYVFPGESFVVSGTNRSVQNEAVVSDQVKAVSAMILRADTLENAVLLAKDCPVLDYGGTIEVREIKPRPAVTGN